MNWGDQMNNLTPEQLQQAGLEAVPWETLEDVKLDAWYRSEHRIMWVKIIAVNYEDISFKMSASWGLCYMEHFADLEHSTDNGKTWQPCHNIRPIGGRIEHEKLAVGGEVINKEWDSL